LKKDIGKDHFGTILNKSIDLHLWLQANLAQDRIRRLKEKNGGK
jgi:hypothetical protein